jgi:hypothetical protein
MKDRQPPLYLITGLIIGILAGLLISYVILPVRYTNTEPATLKSEQKTVFRGLVARVFLYEADSARAFNRLALLGEEKLSEVLVSQAQQMVAVNGDATSARGLALLASALTNGSVSITPLAVQPVTGATTTIDLTKSTAVTNTPVPPTSTPFATYTPRPTITPKPTQGSPYQLVGEPKEICDPESDISLLKVYVYDKSGQGVSGVKIQISITEGGQSEFYTGFYPEISNGYADYEMTPGFGYSLRVGEAGETFPGLAVPECKSSGGDNYPGSLELKFKQP